MPKVVYSDSKGLVQEAGAGFSFVSGDVNNHTGLHLYQEEVTITPGTNNKVAGVLSKALPEKSVIHKLAVTTSVANGSGNVALFAWNHSDAAALQAGLFDWTGVLELLGAGSSGEVPNNTDLDYGTAGKTIVNQTAVSVGSDAQSTATITVATDSIVVGTTAINLIDLVENEIEFGFDDDEATADASDVLIYFEDGVDTVVTIAQKIADKINNHPTLEITAVADDSDVILTQDRAGIEGDTAITITEAADEITKGGDFTGGANALKWLYLINQGDNSANASLNVKAVVSVMYSGKGLPA